MTWQMPTEAEISDDFTAPGAEPRSAVAFPQVSDRGVSQAVVVATVVAADGHREVLGSEVGDSEEGVLSPRA
jgi:Transposase, Mutator family